MLPSDEHIWFNTEVRPCEPALRAYLSRRFRILFDHDDIIQETYIRVLSTKRRGQLTSVKSFLFTVARNVAVDMFRRRRVKEHEPLSDHLYVHVLDAMPDAGETLDRKQRQRLLLDAIASLPERCGEVLAMRHFEGLSYKDIGRRLGISPNTVKVHIVKGGRDCAAYIHKRGIFDNEHPANLKSA